MQNFVPDIAEAATMEKRLVNTMPPNPEQGNVVPMVSDRVSPAQNSLTSIQSSPNPKSARMPLSETHANIMPPESPPMLKDAAITLPASDSYNDMMKDAPKWNPESLGSRIGSVRSNRHTPAPVQQKDSSYGSAREDVSARVSSLRRRTAGVFVSKNAEDGTMSKSLEPRVDFDVGSKEDDAAPAMNFKFPALGPSPAAIFYGPPVRGGHRRSRALDISRVMDSADSVTDSAALDMGFKFPALDPALASTTVSPPIQGGHRRSHAIDSSKAIESPFTTSLRRRYGTSISSASARFSGDLSELNDSPSPTVPDFGLFGSMIEHAAPGKPTSGKKKTVRWALHDSYAPAMPPLRTSSESLIDLDAPESIQLPPAEDDEDLWEIGRLLSQNPGNETEDKEQTESDLLAMFDFEPVDDSLESRIQEASRNKALNSSNDEGYRERLRIEVEKTERIRLESEKEQARKSMSEFTWAYNMLPTTVEPSTPSKLRSFFRFNKSSVKKSVVLFPARDPEFSLDPTVSQPTLGTPTPARRSFNQPREWLTPKANDKAPTANYQTPKRNSKLNGFVQRLSFAKKSTNNDKENTEEFIGIQSNDTQEHTNATDGATKDIPRTPRHSHSLRRRFAKTPPA
jgi:hypothetical protein